MSVSTIPAKPSKTAVNSFVDLGQEQVVNINIKLPKSLHHKLRVVSSVKQKSLVGCVLEAVEHYLHDPVISEQVVSMLHNDIRR